MKSWVSAIEGIEKIPEKVVRGTVIGMFTRIVKRSPVDTGRFRGNWQITVNAPSRTQKNTVDNSGPAQATPSSNPAGSVTAVEGAFYVSKQEFPQFGYYITNNLPYAERLEYGWSGQAPSGMIRLSLAEFEQVLREEVAKQ